MVHSNLLTTFVVLWCASLSWAKSCSPACVSPQVCQMVGGQPTCVLVRPPPKRPCPPSQGQSCNIPNCKVDSDCKGSQSCCPQRCGGRVCKDLPATCNPPCAVYEVCTWKVVPCLIPPCPLLPTCEKAPPICKPMCPKGEECRYVHVVCATQPCHPMSKCVPIITCQPPCGPNQICKLTTTKAACIAGQPCPVMSASCVSHVCNPVCKPNYECKWKQVQCATTPCYPVADCVLKPPMCAKPCAPGSMCHYVLPNLCTNSGPCPPVAACVSDYSCKPPCKPGETCQVTPLRAPCVPGHICPRVGASCVKTPCSLKIDGGLCKALYTKWGFDNVLKKCRTFNYGGCPGNANRFNTQLQCVTACPTPCSLPIVPGPCKAFIPSWGYDSVSQECILFIYGGCLGNSNRFSTKTACEAACPPCSLPIVPGPCKGSFPRWGYDTVLQTCRSFIYGGCGGNANRFLTKAACDAICDPPCSLPIVPGYCKGSYPRWGYDTSLHYCRPFTYGGCGGNANSFLTKAACDAVCDSTPKLTCANILCKIGYNCRMIEVKCVTAPCPPIPTCVPIRPGVCPIPTGFGICVEDCQQDADCQPNEKCCSNGCGHTCQQIGSLTCATVRCPAGTMCLNLIEKKCRKRPCPTTPKCVPKDGDCRLVRCAAGLVCKVVQVPCNKIGQKGRICLQVRCVPNDPCKMRKDSGPCKARFPMYYYNKFANKCRKFYYGGCLGNANRFSSLRDCQRRCVNPCNMKKDRGPCKARFLKWYYHAKSKQCRVFFYGGCKGNANRFSSKADCEKSCLPPPAACATIRCGFDTVCKLVMVICKKGPCSLVAQCVPRDPCKQKKDVGPCEALIPRFYYDPGTNLCHKFKWGGCGGNDNRFMSKKKCLMACQTDPCKQDINYGNPCRAAIPSWGYDKNTMKCIKFSYGGCNGNSNRFKTLEACMRACDRQHLCPVYRYHPSVCLAKKMVSNCANDADCCDPTKICCNNGCGGKHCITLVMPSP